jgi:release factor glutamine methyltransferase
VELKQALTSAVNLLESADVGSPRLNAETLIMFVLGCNRAYLYAHPERELTADEESRYDEVLTLRARGTPSQYITGHQEFWGLDLLVSPAVLIPRPETEHLVETVLDLAQELQQQGSRPLKIVDVGTGSGCVALALAHELKNAEVFGVDLSPEALEIARANAARLQLTSRTQFLRANVLRICRESVSASGANDADGNAALVHSPDEVRDVDIVVSNPPYVGFNEADKVQRSVKEFEPTVAVFAGEHGLDVIRPLIEQAHATLNPGGWLAMEIGYSMRDVVLALFSPTMWEEPRVVPDLQGIPRVIAARKT